MATSASVFRNFLLFLKDHHLNVLSILLIMSILNLTSGCSTYYKIDRIYPPQSQSAGKLMELNYINKNFYLVYQGKKIAIDKIAIDNDKTSLISTFYQELPMMAYNHIGKNEAFYLANQQQEHVIYEVHIHVSEYPEHVNEKVKIPLSAINKVEVFDPYKGVTIAAWVAVAAVIIIIYILTSIAIKQYNKDAAERRKKFWDNI
jgi:hypothetical protein